MAEAGGDTLNDLARPVVDEYEALLRAKIKLGERAGFDVDDAEMNPALKDHTRAAVRWGLGGGRRGWFMSFGLHKTCIQLEAMRLIGTRHNGIRLITLPLGVRQEFFNDAARFFTGEYGISLKFIRRAAEIEDDRTIYLTNYESVREGILDIATLAPVAVSLDEAAILRGFGGTKTFREVMALLAGDDRRDRSQRVESRGIPFRFVATATPSPNEYIELLAYAAFLGIMDVGQAKTRFFKRDSTKADELTIHPHKEREFWLWVASWALFVQKPSDIGFSDDGYELPPLDVRWHEIPSDHSDAGTEKDGQGRMFKNAALGVQEAAKEKRATIDVRVAKALEIVLDGRRQAREKEGPGARALRGEQGEIRSEGQGVAVGESRALQGGDRTLQRREQGQGSRDQRTVVSREQSACSGDESEVEAQALRSDPDAIQRDAGAPGLRVRDLPTHACASDDAGRGSLARDGNGPGRAVPTMQCGAGLVRGQHGQPGEGAGVSQHDAADQGPQVIVWCDLNDEQRAFEAAFDSAGITFSSLYGSQPIEDREQLLADWKDRRTTIFLSKTSMYGAGVNLQQSHEMVFAGVHFKFHEVIQGVHRIQRFGQLHACTAHFIYTEAEREIRREFERKWKQHIELVGVMTGIIKEYGLSSAAMASELGRSIGCERQEARGERYVLANNDCVDETRRMESDSVGLILTSIPFSHQYEYSPSYNDFGHTDDNAHFWRQMDFLTPELYRVLQPGRVCAIHVKDRITPGGINGFGFQTVTRISDQCADHFERHGFAFLARKTIVTDVVRENNQTYRLGWSEQCKDGSRMGAGLPEYVLLFRKPPTDRSNGYADVLVEKAKKDTIRDDNGKFLGWENPDGYSRGRWQYDAHGFTRSSGDRLLCAEDLVGLPQEKVFKLFRKYSLENVYDFERDVALAEGVDAGGWLPSKFMLLPPQSWHPDVWTDVTRMRTLNAEQWSHGKEMHLCPLQFDIVDRIVTQFSMEDDEVYDPFCGLGTVPMRAIKKRRRGRGAELNTAYWRDSIAYCRNAEHEIAMPSLFDLIETEAEEAA